MLERISTIRERIRYDTGGGPDLIGCVLIAQPVFFPKDRWVNQPSDWPIRTQTDKSYDLAQGETPLMLFESEEATVIWVLPSDGLSGGIDAGGWA